MDNVQDRSAEGLLSFLVATFEKYKVDKGGAVSQAYDGASVMSGEFSVCDRPVIYIHCYCHRLHLIVIAVLESIPDLGDHLAIVSSLYNFFSLYKVKKMYTGTSLHKLITTRWSGHYFAINAIEGNLKEIIAVLKKSSMSQHLDSSQRVTSPGLKHRVDDPKFMYINTMLNEALGLIDIGNKTLQSRKKTLNTAIKVIKRVRNELENMRNIHSEDYIYTVMSQAGKKCRPARETHQPSAIANFVVDTPILSISSSSTVELQRLLVESLDRLNSELERRFDVKDMTIWAAMDALNTSADGFLNPETVCPIFEYCLEIPAGQESIGGKSLEEKQTVLAAECRVFRETIQNPLEEGLPDDAPIEEVLNYLEANYNESAPYLIQIFKVAVTAGYTQTCVECLFSALNRIDTPHRRNQLSTCQTNLTLLHFEQEVTRG